MRLDELVHVAAEGPPAELLVENFRPFLVQRLLPTPSEVFPEVLDDGFFGGRVGVLVLCGLGCGWWPLSIREESGWGEEIPEDGVGDGREGRVDKG
jgi:hypothetical protein